MKIVNSIITIMMLFCASFSEEVIGLKKMFENSGVIGSIAIKKVGEKSIVFNDSIKADEQVKPASTFKILNTLIALDGKYINELETIKWDKIVRDVDQWNADQTLMSAFKYSCVWVYEIIEKKVGIQNYQKHLHRTNYGNMKAGDKDTAFWLYGDLRISTKEQINFLEGVYQKKYGFAEKSYDVLKDLMIDNITDEYKLYGKTGFVDDIGWYVGYVETKSGVWLFATRLEGVNTAGDRLKLRKELTMKALSILKII